MAKYLYTRPVAWSSISVLKGVHSVTLGVKALRLMPLTKKQTMSIVADKFITIPQPLDLLDHKSEAVSLKLIDFHRDL